MKKIKNRCSYVNSNPLYIKYHDTEWGVSEHSDAKLFEFLILECFQAGLSWECILNKRENFRAAFDNFNVEKLTFTFSYPSVLAILSSIFFAQFAQSSPCKIYL